MTMLHFITKTKGAPSRFFEIYKSDDPSYEKMWNFICLEILLRKFFQSSNTFLNI